MLIQNKCWLCQETFPRGKVKKVFQISHLLDYFKKRLEMESKLIPTPPLHSKYLKSSYERYVALAKTVAPDQFMDQLLKELTEYDVEVWMSGLTCDINEICKREVRFFLEILEVPPEVTNVEANGNSNTHKKQKGSDVVNMMTFANKDCPPGCNCDNPWPFLS